MKEKYEELSSAWELFEWEYDKDYCVQYSWVLTYILLGKVFCFLHLLQAQPHL